MWNLENGAGSDISDVLHGEPYAGKLHVAPLLCYGVTGWFDEEGLPPKTMNSVLRVAEGRAGVPDKGRRSTLRPMEVQRDLVIARAQESSYQSIGVLNGREEHGK